MNTPLSLRGSSRCFHGGVWDEISCCFFRNIFEEMVPLPKEYVVKPTTIYKDFVVGFGMDA